MIEQYSESKLFLTSLECIGYKTIDKIICEYGSYEDFFKLTDEKILSCNILTGRQSNIILEARKNWNYCKYLEKLKRNNISLVTREEEEYPEKLLSIPDPPFQLFYSGELPKEDMPSVAIIGARNCSEYGKQCAKYFAGGLANKGVQIISGLASGIDGIAQREAVDKGGKSYGILGCGADICYPASNFEIYNKVIDNGGLITEFPPGSKPLAMHFPMRNRIISGLADIVLVIEAKEKSGTAITVNMALEQGKEVFAVPGRINDRLSDGCNRLISEGAGMARTVDDILTALGMKYPVTHSEKLNNTLDLIVKDTTLSEMAKYIACYIYKKNISYDELYGMLALKYSITIQQVRQYCFELVFAGYAVEEGGSVGIF